ncbi:TetR/AcrR family transcriptional regulator [Allorhizobium pseudoryzae]|jgi:AcrR family transcriptional regulator|uniref:TetR/AcrR family transcriptional regulator n=1 Tax=Allorhizobium pseudoryzae TaxID=379684 RepID=UPI0013EB22BD|nr:TetR/AcrR family transcriptional regulator [Allorhizobium pseudoryzae]
MIQPEQPPSQTMKRGRGRPKTHSDEERLCSIIETARRTFAELGLVRTTTDIVASRCRISKQTLYRLFPSKNDLFLAVVVAHRQMMLDLPRPPEEDEPLEAVISKIFMIDIDPETERERDAFIRIVMLESPQVPELADILHREGPETARRQLAAWLKQEIARGKMHLDDPMAGARMLLDLMFGAGGPRGWENLEERRHHMRHAINLFVRGTRPA